MPRVAVQDVVNWFRAILFVGVATLWLLPLVLFGVAVFQYGKPLLSLACLLCMSASVLVIKLPERYFRPRRFELRRRLYERLGIRRFKRWMLDGEYMNAQIRRRVPGYRIIGSRASMRRFEGRTRESERGHLIWLLVTIPAIVYSGLMGWRGLALYFVLSALPINLYPIMLQRYTRARIVRLLQEPDPQIRK